MRFRTVILGTLSVAVLASSAVWFGARRQRERFQYYRSPVDQQLPRLLRGTGYSVHELTTPDGITLRGIIRPPPTASDPCLVLFPGNSQQQLAAALPLLEGMRQGRAAGAAVFAYRGFDGSTGVPGPSVAAEDARSVLEYLRTQFGVAPERLALVGYSMGSGIAARAAAELTQRHTPPHALAMLSPFYTLDLAPARPFNVLWPSETYRVEDVLPKLQPPVLVVGAGNDSALPVAQHARPLAAALGARAEYWELPGKDHADYLQDPQLLARVGRFVLGF